MIKLSKKVCQRKMGQDGDVPQGTTLGQKVHQLYFILCTKTIELKLMS
jgi:hypothetical protein